MSTDQPGLLRWWNGLGRGQQVLVATVGLLVVVNLTLAGARSILGGDPGGPVSSSFSTGGDGLEAYADLVAAAGHPVVRQRASIVEVAPPPTATLVVADPGASTDEEARSLARFVRAGGRLVIAGSSAADLVGAVTGAPIRWRSASASDQVRVWLPGAQTGTARTLGGDQGGRWADVGELLPVAGVGNEAVIVSARVGRGSVVAIADAGLLQNASLGEDDNAALALAAVGSAERPVVFVESVHGFDRAGLEAVPSSWKWAAAGLGVAVLIGLWAAGSRFGPPEPLEREQRPARRAHVDAVAAGMDRVTPDPAAAAAPLAVRARAHLASDLGVEHDAAPAVLHDAMVRAGADPSEIERLASPPGDLPQALLIGRVAASHQRASRRSALADVETATRATDLNSKEHVDD